MKARATSLLILLLAGSAAARGGVTVSHARNTDFARFATYSWSGGTPSTHPQIERHIREAVDLELQARGLVESDGPADLTVVTHATSRAETREDLDILGRPAAAPPEGQWADPHLRRMEMGRLVVELADGASGLQVWRAAATEIFDLDPDRSPKRARKRIMRIVAKMFKDFPPRD